MTPSRFDAPLAGHATDHVTDNATDSRDLPPGLTTLDLTRIAGAAAAAQAPTTQRIYQHAWGSWVRWCRHRGIVALPADPAAISAYLSERVDAGLAVVSLGPIGCAIAHVHRLHGFPNPMDDPTVRQVRAGLRRLHGTAPRRQARPLSVPELKQILAAIDRTTLYGARDAAIILLGYASALRSSELAALTLADLETQPGGLLLRIRKSKTDQDGAGQVVGVAHGNNPDTDPISAVHHWLRHRATTTHNIHGDTHADTHDALPSDGRYGPPGPLFVRMRGGTISNHPLAPHTISRLLTAHAEAAGLPAARITSHSLRAGHATTAYTAGIHIDRIVTCNRFPGHRGFESPQLHRVMSQDVGDTRTCNLGPGVVHFGSPVKESVAVVRARRHGRLHCLPGHAGAHCVPTIGSWSILRQGLPPHYRAQDGVLGVPMGRRPPMSDPGCRGPCLSRR